MLCKICGNEEQTHNQLLKRLVIEFEDKTSQKVRIVCDKIPTHVLTSKVFDEMWTKARAESYYEIVRSDTINECTKKKFIDTVGESIGFALP